MSSADNDATCLPLGSINPASPSILSCLLLLQLLLQGAHGLQALLLYEYLGIPDKNLAPLFPKIRVDAHELKGIPGK